MLLCNPVLLDDLSSKLVLPAATLDLRGPSCLKIEPAFVTHPIQVEFLYTNERIGCYRTEEVIVSRDTIAIFVPLYIRQGKCHLVIKDSGVTKFDLSWISDSVGQDLHSAIFTAQQETHFYRKRYELQSLPFDQMLEEAGAATMGGMTAVTMITGSVGKTTTKELIGRALLRNSKVVVSTDSWNYPHEICWQIVQHRSVAQHVVLECALSPHMGELSRALTPSVLVFTTLGPAHLSEGNTIEASGTKKAQLISGLREDGVIFYNADCDVLCDAVTTAAKYYKREKSLFSVASEKEKIQDPPSVRFSVQEGVKSGYYRLSLESTGNDSLLCLECDELEVPSWLDPINVALAQCVYQYLGGKGSVLRDDESDLHVPFRKQVVEAGANLVINDAYNANPMSMESFLTLFRDLKGTRPLHILVLGDMLDLGAMSHSAHKSVLERAMKEADFLLVVGERLGAAAVDTVRSSKIELRTCSTVAEAEHLLKDSLIAPALVGFKGSNATGILAMAERFIRESGVRSSLGGEILDL